MKKIVLPTLLAASVLMASDNVSQSVEFGLANTTGNSDSTTINAAYNIEYQHSETVGMDFMTDFFYSKKEGDVSDERYRAKYNLDKLYPNDWFSYFRADWLRNTFSGFNHKVSLGAGGGKIVYKDDRQELKLRVGPMWRYGDLTTNETCDYFGLNEGSYYTYKLDDKDKFYANFDAVEKIEEFNEYEFDFETGLVFLIIKDLSFKFAFELNYVNEPVNDKKNTDTKTTASIVYNF